MKTLREELEEILDMGDDVAKEMDITIKGEPTVKVDYIKAILSRHPEEEPLPDYSDIPTQNLIAELERRRPCKRCEHWRHNSTPCMNCFWKGLWNMGEALHTDNFKEAK